MGYLTVATNRVMSAFFRKRLAEAGLGLTAEQWGVLCQLWNEGAVTQDALAARLCVDKSSLSRVLDNMERKGLVKRERDPSDARKKILLATTESEGLKGPCKEVADRVTAEVLKDCDPREIEICLKVLNQVKQSVKGAASEE